MIVPLPQRFERLAGTFALTADTVLEATGRSAPVAQTLAATLRPATGYVLPVLERVPEGTKAIRLELDPHCAGGASEGYELEAVATGVRVRGADAAGLYYATRSLLQLLPPAVLGGGGARGATWSVPACRILDRPRFRWRGAMLDCARHFMPLEFVKRFIDLLALHKLNVFHWHLTEDQGWRLEIRRYPRLVEVGAWRSETRVGHALEAPERYDGRPHGGYYTQDDVREVVRYAAERFVTVMPEIEMPGHATAAIASYPELGHVPPGVEPPSVATTWGVFDDVFNVRDETFAFLEGVLEEALELFPSAFIHVGGDEVPKRQWRDSADAQALMRSAGLTDEDALQSLFIRRIGAFLTARGRRLVGWDEILEGGLAPGATVMSWRGTEGGVRAARMGHDVVMTPATHTYLDAYASERTEDEPLAIGGHLPLERVYAFEPVPDELEPEHHERILGAQAQLWTEYMPTPERVEYRAFPRLAAFAEVVWSAADAREYREFLVRLALHRERLRALGVRFQPWRDGGEAGEAAGE